MTDKVKIEDNQGCSVKEIADSLGLTPRRIQQMVGACILPKPEKRGKYDLVACIKANHQRKELRRLSARNRKKKSKLKGFNSLPQKTDDEIKLDIEALQNSIREMLNTPKRVRR